MQQEGGVGVKVDRKLLLISTSAPEATRRWRGGEAAAAWLRDSAAAMRRERRSGAVGQRWDAVEEDGDGDGRTSGGVRLEDVDGVWRRQQRGGEAATARQRDGDDDGAAPEGEGGECRRRAPRSGRCGTTVGKGEGRRRLEARQDL